VIGGGVAGLAVGWLLRARGRSVVVAEAADRPGGVIRTSHRDGLRIEHGPQSLRGGTADLWSWIEAVGLAHAVVPSAPAASTRYLLQGGRLVALPSGPLGLLRTPLLSRRARLRGVYRCARRAERAHPGDRSRGERAPLSVVWGRAAVGLFEWGV
jgi:oxygen-dependent protoporphyrinogen oxidase